MIYCDHALKYEAGRFSSNALSHCFTLFLNSFNIKSSILNRSLYTTPGSWVELTFPMEVQVAQAAQELWRFMPICHRLSSKICHTHPQVQDTQANQHLAYERKAGELGALEAIRPESVQWYTIRICVPMNAELRLLAGPIQGPWVSGQSRADGCRRATEEVRRSQSSSGPTGKEHPLQHRSFSSHSVLLRYGKSVFILLIATWGYCWCVRRIGRFSKQSKDLWRARESETWRQYKFITKEKFVQAQICAAQV